MTVGLFALTTFLCAAAAQDAPLQTVGLERPAIGAEAYAENFRGALTGETPVVAYSVDDAPSTPGQSFLASGLTSFTGLMVLFGLPTGPPTSLPMGTFAFTSRLATSLFLMSAGPSMGDLLNHDAQGFLIGALGRSALVALSWGAVAVASTPGVDPLLSVTSVLFVTVAGLVWTGWCTVDLVRALFAPARWVERENDRRGVPRKRSSGVFEF